MTEQELRDHAERFRRCLEELKSELGLSFLSFPAGSCGTSSRLFGQWLTEHGVTRIVHVIAQRGGKGHAWLDIDDLIIDLTADQYDHGPGAVYIGKGRSFHGHFQDEVRVAHRLNKELEDGYELCKHWMSEHPNLLSEDL